MKHKGMDIAKSDKDFKAPIAKLVTLIEQDRRKALPGMAKWGWE